MPVQYSFTTVWNIHAPVELVWDAIYDSGKWPDWWKDFQSVVEIKKGNDNDIGTIRRFELKSPFIYTLKFDLKLTERENHKHLKAIASGNLEGTGAWDFRQAGNVTITTCTWKVSTNIPWMNAFAFLLKPFFKFNHNKVMNNGENALIKYLNATSHK